MELVRLLLLCVFATGVFIAADVPPFSIQWSVLIFNFIAFALTMSGMSAGYAISLITPLLKQEPVGPLRGTDDEWVEVSDGCFQNKRCSHVFKKNGKAYDIEGKIFEDDNGCCYTSRESRVDVEFPYVPKHEYIKVKTEDVNTQAQTSINTTTLKLPTFEQFDAFVVSVGGFQIRKVYDWFIQQLRVNNKG